MVAVVVLSWNGREDTLACLRSLDASHQQIVIVAFAMARGRNHCERDRGGVKRPRGGGPANTTTAAPAGV